MLERSAPAPDLSDEQAAELLECLPRCTAICAADKPARHAEHSCCAAWQHAEPGAPVARSTSCCSAEERRVLACYSGAPGALSGAEQFMLEAMGVPALEARVEAWRFAHRFAGHAAPLQAAAALLAGACGEVQDSELLRDLLKVALLAGGHWGDGPWACREAAVKQGEARPTPCIARNATRASLGPPALQATS